MSFIGSRRALLSSGARASFAWDFAARQALPPGATFTRASAGRYFDGAGVLQSAGTNVARFDHDPLTGAPLGYLAEMQSTNQVTKSRDFSPYFNTNVALVQDGTLGPDGAAQMYKITASAGAGDHYSRVVSSAAVLTNDTYSMSFVVKQGTARYVTIGDDGAASWHLGTFDFQTGTWSNQTNVTGEARQLASGLWRIGIKVVSSSNHTVRACIGFGGIAAGVSSIQNFTAVGTETGYALETQVETGGVGVTSIIPTAGATATRAQDVLSLPLTALPGWNASQGGVLVAAYRLNTIRPTGYQVAASIYDVALNNGIQMAPSANGTQDFRMYSGGALKFSVGGTLPTALVRHKIALGWSASRGQPAYDGTLGAIQSGAYALPVNPANLYLCSDVGDTLNGTLESIAYYRGARSDAFVQQVSR